MSGSDWLTVAGLALEVAGALVLAWRDFRPGRVTYADNARGFPRTREAQIGFPLIALGALLQIVAITTN